MLLENKSTEQIAGETGLEKDNIHVRLRRIFGLHPRAVVRRVHGEIVSNAWLDKLLRRFGTLYKFQAAHPMGVPSSRLYSIGKRRENLALEAHSAERLIRLERAMLAHLFLDKGNQPQHFRAVVPDLPEKYEAARNGIALLRPFVGQVDGFMPLMNELCSKSQLATAKGEGSHEGAILLWIPEILSWLTKGNSTPSAKPSEVALEFLAADYHTKKWVVYRALRDDCQATSSTTIASIIRTSFRSWPEKAKPGRTPDSTKDRQAKTFYKVGFAVEQAMPHFDELIKVRRSYPKTIRDNQRRLRAELVKTGFSESEIAAGISAKDAKIAARWFVAAREERDRDLVARYHKMYKFALSLPKNAK